MTTEAHTQKRLPLSSGEEQDALTPWHHVLIWRAGQRHKTKAKYQRRMRREVRASLDAERQQRECHTDGCLWCYVSNCPDSLMWEDDYAHSSEHEHWLDHLEEEGRDG